MEQKMTQISPRMARLKARITDQLIKETDTQAALIQNRPGHTPALSSFLKTVKQSCFPEKFVRHTHKKVIFHLCIQAPPELFHAAGVQPFKLSCGSHASLNMAPLHLPALTCPMIESLSGLIHLDNAISDCVIPTTCDWVVKFSELNQIVNQSNIHFMELPHLRENELSARRWFAEVKHFKTWLEAVSHNTIRPKTLFESIRIYASAFGIYRQLVESKRTQIVPAIDFALILNAMPYMDIETWMAKTGAYLDQIRPTGNSRVSIFLTGSPIVFPNFKLLHLMDQAGMAVIADDLCTMERSFPDPAVYQDPSEYSLLKALSQRGHTACTCPTFADNQRRVNTLMAILEKHRIKGVIFHVLKGCHPYDMESGIMEMALKEKGVRFLKIETDYVKEDEQNIITRLEAFKRTL